ncbi:MAG: response regulator, partial [Flavobacteriales bacterium]
AEVQEKGFGLGLSITKEIIELHGGEIGVESIRNGGSTFSMTLHKGRSHFKNDKIEEDFVYTEHSDYYLQEGGKVSKNIEIQSEWSELKNLTLLVVEDNADIRLYLKNLLSTHCKVLHAENGEKALKIALSQQPDLIISDVMMPVMDGIELTRKLKSDVQTSHIPIILLTARASIVHKMEGYSTGADDYITKPFNEALLRARIQNLIHNRQLLRERFGSDVLLTLDELPVNKADQKFLEDLIKIIQNNVDNENLNANYLSREIGMSHSVIYKKVKSLSGMTLVEFVRDYKLKIAKTLISEQGYSVSDACYKVGYSDRKYFSKLFKQKFGKNPSDFSE